MDWNAVKDVVILGGVGVVVYGATHVSWAKTEIAALKTDLAIIKKAASADVAEVRGWFDHTVPTTTVPVAVSVAAKAPVPITTQAPVPLSTTTTTKSPGEVAGETTVRTWLAPSINWNLVSSAELTVLFKQQIATAGVETLISDTGIMSTIPVGGVPSPNFEIQSRVYRGLSTTESERAYVGYNNADGIGAHYLVDYLGNVSARA